MSTFDFWTLWNAIYIWGCCSEWQMYDHAQTFTQMYDSKLQFCNRLNGEIPTKSVEREARAMSRQSAFRWSMPAESFCVCVTVTMKCCRLTLRKDHGLFKSLFTNIISGSTPLPERGLWEFVVFCQLLLPPKAGLHYWLQKSKCNLASILLLGVCKSSSFPSCVSAVRDFHSLDVNGSCGFTCLQMGFTAW